MATDPFAATLELETEEPSVVDPGDSPEAPPSAVPATDQTPDLEARITELEGQTRQYRGAAEQAEQRATQAEHVARQWHAYANQPAANPAPAVQNPGFSVPENFDAEGFLEDPRAGLELVGRTIQGPIEGRLAALESAIQFGAQQLNKTALLNHRNAVKSVKDLWKNQEGWDDFDADLTSLTNAFAAGGADVRTIESAEDLEQMLILERRRLKKPMGRGPREKDEPPPTVRGGPKVPEEATGKKKLSPAYAAEARKFNLDPDKDFDFEGKHAHHATKVGLT